ncbi:transposase [Streptosporangium canum]|uniref:transposase n=1 Tax=Streptosporangium canum TaxID=324952 RepID=UPI003433993A
MTERKPYPSDLTDARWALIEPVLTAWKAAHPSVGGHEGVYGLREIVNAIRYQGRTGVQWDYPPHDLPPKSATYYYFAKWRARRGRSLPSPPEKTPPRRCRAGNAAWR